MFRRSRRRFCLSLLVLASLLFQHVAVAAYACAPAPPPPRMPAGMEHCAAMPAESASIPATPLCQKHCAPDQTLLADHAALHVPALAPPPLFALVLDAPAAQATHRPEVPISRSDPPPRLRYCSLLI